MADPPRPPPDAGPDGLGGNYAKLWTAAAVSNLGDGVRAAALPLLAASLTRDPVQVAAVTFAGALPWLFFALPGGALADRVDRRRLMWTVDALRSVVAAVLGLAVLAGATTVALLCGVAFVLGAAETLFDSTTQAVLPAVVPHDRLERANGRLYSAELVANGFVGPPVGSLLFAAAPAVAFLADAGSFAVAALLVAALRGQFRTGGAEARAPTTLRADVAEGLRWLWGHRLLRSLALMLGAWNLLETAWLSVLVLFATETLGLGEAGYGLLFAAFAAGGVAGSLAAPRISGRVGLGPALVGSVLSSGLTVAVVGLTSEPTVAGAMLVVFGFGAMVWNVLTASLRQSIIPDRLLGRVSSSYRLLTWGTVPLGAALGGFLARALGLRAPFLVYGVGVTAMAVVALRVLGGRAVAEARTGGTGSLS